MRIVQITTTFFIISMLYVSLDASVFTDPHFENEGYAYNPQSENDFDSTDGMTDNENDTYDSGDLDDQLLYVVMKNNYADVKDLLQNHADVHHQTNHGFTALHYAALENNKPMLRLLLQYGANPNAKNNQGNTPLHIAVMQDSVDVIEDLLLYGARKNIRNNLGNTPVTLSRSKMIDYYLVM